jgi:hypothetical protein
MQPVAWVTSHHSVPICTATATGLRSSETAVPACMRTEGTHGWTDGWMDGWMDAMIQPLTATRKIRCEEEQQRAGGECSRTQSAPITALSIRKTTTDERRTRLMTEQTTDERTPGGIHGNVRARRDWRCKHLSSQLVSR